MSTPREDGFRWPAEWEPHEATWLSWPHNEGTWPGQLDAAEDAFVEMVRALTPREAVRINVQDEAATERVVLRLQRAGVARGFECFLHPTDDAWVRDHGPVFVVSEAGERRVVDFGFDAWGRKYPPWDRDDAIPAQVARALSLERYEPGFVLEAGSIDGDGLGTVLTTESCLLHPNRRREREPERTREEMERRLVDWLGARQVIWLGDGIVGDDTDGHVDDITRFVSPGVVVTAVESDPADANHEPLERNLARLRSAVDARGQRLDIVPLPMPPPVEVDGVRCPASYANFYLANDVALVPVFDVAADAGAIAILGELLPEREVAPIPARALVQGLGAVHCLTQQEPAC